MTKKSLFKIVFCVVCLVVAMDVGMNYAMKWYIYHYEIPGDYMKIDYMFKHINTQILLLGASTCMNSINPEKLEKELGKKVFNAGINDQRLEFFDVMSEAIFKRTPPELLILVLRQNDLTISGKGRLAMMNIYYHLGNTKLDEYLDEGNLKKRLLLKSALYRFNTYWWRMLLYHFKSFDELAHGGFVGKPVPVILPSHRDIISSGNVVFPLNPRKVHCLENILLRCRKTGTRLWIVITPELINSIDGAEFGGLSQIRSFCNQNNIPFINDSQHPDFIDHPEYFFDSSHLNVNGAELYTQRVLKLLQQEESGLQEGL